MKKWFVLLSLFCVVSLPAAAGAQVTLWDQTLPHGNGIIAQDYEAANDSMDIYMADDFTNAAPWEIQSIYTEKFPGFQPYSCATSLNWMIFGDGGTHPAGDPSGGGFPPVWSLSLPPSDPAVAIAGDQLTVNIPPVDRPVLPPGTWWLAVYVEADSSVCGAMNYWSTSISTNGAVATGINPAGGWGVGPDWFPITDVDITAHDFLFALTGEVTVCPAVYTPATGGLTIPEVDIMGTTKSYAVNMIRTAAPGIVFELTLARKEATGCDTATYNPATGILDIHRLGVMGTAKSLIVEMTEQPGPWYYFEVTNITK